MQSENLINRITVNPAVCHGKPTVRNMRYTVESILEYLSGGDSVESILEEFNDLEREDILACLEYATLVVKTKSIHLAA